MTNGDIGKLIEQRRAAAEMTQQELGNAIGKDSRSVSSYENASCDMKVSTLLKIADAFGITVTELLNGPRRKHATEIRVYQLDDRMQVAAILVKNGYTVSQVKRSKDGQKTVEYRLRLEESDENIRVIRKRE